jgi:hypothetical protein
MPELKTRNLFISHAWQYDADYHTLIKWFNDEPNFSWKNYSVPSHDALPDKTDKGLREGITRQMSPSQAVIIIAGMYAAHSGWIDYEIDEAKRMGKIIIGIRPWGQQKMPVKVQDASHEMVNWQSASIIQVIRKWV